MKRLSVPMHFFRWSVPRCCARTAFAKKPPQEWDGLTLVKLKGLDAAYARPGADFTIYNKIIIDPIQVAFAKGWDKEETFSGNKLSANQLEEIKGKISKVAEETFAQVFSEKGGPQIVTAPGPDVLRFSSAIVDVWPNAVDTQEPGTQSRVHDQLGQRHAVRGAARFGNRPAHRPGGRRARGAQFRRHALDQFRREHAPGTHDGVRPGRAPCASVMTRFARPRPAAT